MTSSSVPNYKKKLIQNLRDLRKIVAREMEKDLDLRLASDQTRKEKKDYTKKDIEAIIMEI